MELNILICFTELDFTADSDNSLDVRMPSKKKKGERKKKRVWTDGR